MSLAGCAAAPPAAGPPAALEIPAGWTGAQATTGAATSLVNWWRGLGDPLLTGLVEQALAANTGVLGAQAALRQARALRDVAGAALLPGLNASGSAQRNKTAASSTANVYQAGLDASWEVDIFGANRSTRDAAQANAGASAASLGDVQVSLAAEVALDYVALRSAQARLAIAQDNLGSQLQTLQITQWRQQAGLVTTLETEQARAAAEQTRATLPLLQITIGQTAHALAVLTGQPPAALLATLSAPGSLPQPGDALALDIPAQTLRQRADVRAAEWQVTAAAARVDAAEAARLPSFTLGGSVGLSALTVSTLTNSTSIVSTLLASVAMPLFDGGSRRAQVRAQQAALDQAQASYTATVLTALKDVEDALLALRGDRERAAGLQVAATSASHAADLARQRFSGGLIDFQTVLETQRTQLSTQDGLAGARADVAADHVRLFKALGGGWRSDDDKLQLTRNSTR